MDRVNCRVCNEKLVRELSLGELYISDFVKSKDDGVKSELELGKCQSCGLIQLSYEPDLDFMYKDHYWYRSGLNASMLKDLENIVRDIEGRIDLYYDDLIIDIGTNDASLLTFYKYENLYKVGFDPAPNVKEYADVNCTEFINDYFKYDSRFNKKAKVITSIAMFYDLPDPNKFVEDVKATLDEEGIWIIQFTDLYSMLRINAIDNICGEHIEYYKLSDVKRLVESHGLEIFDISYNDVNGGSVRIFIGYPNVYEVSFIVDYTIKYQNRYFETNNLTYLALKINSYKNRIWKYINSEVTGDIYGIAASTKGNTMLQILGFDSSNMKGIGEINEDKFGLFTSGTMIPILPEKEVLDNNPELIIVLAWHFRETFDNILKEYIENGGKVLYPLPIPELHTKEGVINL